MFSIVGVDALPTKDLQSRIEALKVLVVDDDLTTRKVVRTMLLAIGVRTLLEASDGVTGLDSIRTDAPDLVIVDWQMPQIDGAEFVRRVRSPGAFPRPDVPIVMLTGHSERWRVEEAARLGAHQFLLKPISTKALRDCVVAILGNPRPIVKLGDYYGPLPRLAGPGAGSETKAR
jgi:two-component system chemotaxis response regulator CheY